MLVAGESERAPSVRRVGAVVSFAWMAVAVATGAWMALDAARDPWDPRRVGTRRYGHNGPSDLRTGLILVAVELALVLAVTQPWRGGRLAARSLIMLVLAFAWSCVMGIFTMHAGGVITIHLLWMAVVDVGLAGMAVAAAVASRKRGPA